MEEEWAVQLAGPAGSFVPSVGARSSERYFSWKGLARRVLRRTCLGFEECLSH